MFGAVVIWYVAGGIIALMVGLEVHAKRLNPKQSGVAIPLLWFALSAAALIYVMWPWVAMNLAQNVSM